MKTTHELGENSVANSPAKEKWKASSLSEGPQNESPGKGLAARSACSSKGGCLVSISSVYDVIRYSGRQAGRQAGRQVVVRL